MHSQFSDYHVPAGIEMTRAEYEAALVKFVAVSENKAQPYLLRRMCELNLEKAALLRRIAELEAERGCKCGSGASVSACS